MQIGLRIIYSTIFTLSAAGAFACVDLWSNAKVVQALNDLAVMRMNLDLKKVEDPNSLVFGQLDLEFKKKEAEFIKTLRITEKDLKEKIKDKIKTLQQGRDLEVKKQKAKESLIKEHTQAIHENVGLKVEEVVDPKLGIMLKIKKDGVPLKVLWRKEAVAHSIHNGVIAKDRIDYKALDPNNLSLVHPDSQARKLCFDLGGDLPTKEEWDELWEAVDKNLDELERIIPGIKEKIWWSSSVHPEYSDVGWLFGEDDGYTDWEYDRKFAYSVRCVLR